MVDATTQSALTGDTSPAVAENTTSAVAAYNGADPESDTLTWSVNNDAFWISQRGNLYFASPPPRTRPDCASYFSGRLMIV